MNKRKIWTGVICGGVAVVLIAAAVAAPRMKKEPVTVIPVMEVSYPDFGYGGSESFGMVTTDKVQAIFPSDTQTVTEVLIAEGQSVAKGDVLYTYDTTLSDLALERKDLDIQQKEVSLRNAQKDLRNINAMKPMVIPEPTVPTEPPAGEDDFKASPRKEQLGTAYAGTGTALDPYRFWLSREQAVTDTLVEQLLADKESVYVVFGLSPEDQELTPYEYTYGIRYTKTVPQPVPTEPPAPTEGTTPPTETAPAATTAPAETAAPAETTVPAETAAPAETEPAAAAANVIPAPAKAGYEMSFFDPEKLLMPEIPEPEELPDMGSGYTQAEINAMRHQKKEEIATLEFDIRMGKAELAIMRKEAADGQVTAEFDGVVVSLLTPEDAKMQSVPMIKVAGGGGYYVEGSVSELDLGTVKPGQSVTIMSWDTGMSYEGTVAEIGSYPAENGGGYGQSNMTFYPYRVFVDESADLMEGSYVNLSLQQNVESGESLNLENPFLRKEGKKTYVYVKNEEGLLEKRYVRTGASQDGYATPILSGLAPEDMIAFPYGKNVQEGAPTVDGTSQDLYQG